MKVLITGVAGFIGSHVAKALLGMGHDVVGVDILNDYYDTDLKDYRLKTLLADEANFTFQKLDLAEREQVEVLFQDGGFDGVIHLAAQAGVRYSLENPHTYTRNNVEAFLNVLEGCRHHKITRLVYASSSSVYGGLKTTPFSESMAVDQPVSLYAASKKANELMAHTYTHLYGFETVGLRFFTVYGPMGRPDMAIWLFSDAIMNDRPIKVFNHGEMRRDFTYIDDIVSGTVASLFEELPDPCMVFNLGNHRSEALGTFIETIESSLGKKAEKEMLPMQPGDVHETYADVKKAQTVLSYKPSTTLAEGVPRFTAWYLDEWLPYKESLK